MGALIDTCVLIDLERSAGEQAVWRKLPDDELFVSAVTVMELQVGIEYASDAKRTYRQDFLTEVVLKQFECIPLDADIGVTCGRLFKHLESTGQRIGYSDTWIASTALTLGHQVITNNLEHFHRVVGLRVVPWER